MTDVIVSHSIVLIYRPVHFLLRGQFCFDLNVTVGEFKTNRDTMSDLFYYLKSIFVFLREIGIPYAEIHRLSLVIRNLILMSTVSFLTSFKNTLIGAIFV